jgi:outer membrane receptor protein involved in Fe transport
MTRLLTTAFLVLLLPTILLAQNSEIRGRLTDASTNEPLVGATVTLVGTTMGASSDASGSFVIANIPTGSYTLRVAYVGYVSAERRITLGAEVLSLAVALNPTVIESGEVVVEVNRARDRETPVAFTDIGKMAIEQKMHGQDAPLLAQGTPGVYTYSTDGVGNGEAKLLVRGFSQNYVQVLINGVPTNDPESNAVYWSNWGSVSSAAASLQIQRGAGSSLYGAGSFGGSFNIVTADAPPKPSYGVNLSVGSPMNTMYGIDLNSGLIADKFAATLRLGRKIAEGSRVSGRYEGTNYYLSGAWYINDKQSLKLVLHGAPQEHGYSWSNDISYFKMFGYEANPAPFLPRDVVNALPANATNGKERYALLDDSRELVDSRFVNLSHNFYHKPQLELHYRYDLSEATALSVTGFYSRGRGAGSSLSGTGTTYRLNSNGTVTELLGDEGYITSVGVADTVYLKNAYQKISYSFHQQGGVLANFDFKPLDNLKMTVGGEFRSWSADHPGHFTNLFKKTSITTSYARTDTAGRVGTFSRRGYQGDLNGPTSDVGSVFGWSMANDPTYSTQYRNYRGETPQYTLFAQGNWQLDKLNVLASLQYVHYSYKLIENMPSENAIGQMLTRAQEASRGVLAEGQTGTGTFLMKGTDNRWYEFTLVNATRTRGFWQPKAGLNYNFNENLNVFGNFAHVERFVDLSVYYNSGRLNPSAKDEVSNQFELGVGWTSTNLRTKLNGYSMSWDNKSARIRDVSKAGKEGYDYQGYASILVGSSRHQGIELEAQYSLAELLHAKGLELQGTLTYMDNKWKKVVDPVDPVTGQRRAFNTSALGPDGKVDTLYVDEMVGTPVASGPQTMFSLGLNYNGEHFFGGITVYGFARLYMQDGGTYMRTDGYFTAGSMVFVSKFDNKLPVYSTINLNAGYNFDLYGLNTTISAQVLNLLDREYLVDADRSGVIPGLGRAVRMNLTTAF